MKVIYHIDVKDKLSSLIWDLLCTNFNCKVKKACHSENGEELKEWYALASYLGTFEKNEDGISIIPENYSTPEHRKVVYSSTNPVELLKNANIFTWIVIILVLVILAVIALVTTLIVRKIIRKRNKRTA